MTYLVNQELLASLLVNWLENPLKRNLSSLTDMSLSFQMIRFGQRSSGILNYDHPISVPHGKFFFNGLSISVNWQVGMLRIFEWSASREIHSPCMQIVRNRRYFTDDGVLFRSTVNTGAQLSCCDRCECCRSSDLFGNWRCCALVAPRMSRLPVAIQPQVLANRSK